MKCFAGPSNSEEWHAGGEVRLATHIMTIIFELRTLLRHRWNKHCGLFVAEG